MKNVKSFALGAVSSVLALTLVGTALAATGTLTITVDPNVKIQVNGQTFQPKDAQGNSVPVFVYNGTTYAPLRALAESFGLKVGYDEKSNMATVGENTPAKTPDKPAADYSTWTAEEEKAYQEFKGMWKVEFKETIASQDPFLGTRDFYCAYPSSVSNSAMEKWEAMPRAQQDRCIQRLMLELKKNNGIMLTLCKNSTAGASYGFSITEKGEVWLGHY